MKRFQKYNSVSEIQKRYKETIVRKPTTEADRIIKRRRLGSLDPIDDIQSLLPQLPDALREKQASIILLYLILM